VLISVAALYLVFRKTSWSDLTNAFHFLQFWQYILAIVLFLVSLAFRTFGWRALLKNKVPFTPPFLAINEGYLLNNILPFRLGEIGRAIIMGRISELGTFNVLSTIVMERIFDVVISAMLLLTGLALAFEVSSAKSIVWIAMAVIVILFIFLFFLSKKQDSVQKWIDKQSIKSKFFQKFIQKYSSDFIKGLEFFQSPKYFFPAMGWLIAAWILAWLEYFILLRCFVPEATIWWAALGLGALAFGVAIPSAPAYVGVFEGALVLALVPLVGEPQKGLIIAYALVIHITHFVINGLLGLIGFLVQGDSISGLFKDIARHRTQSPGSVE